jgi:ADP-ribosylglycohydrolase
MAGNRTIQSEKQLEDKIRGSILGLAIGDALGFPVEFLTYEDITERYGRSGITQFVHWRFPAGSYSDDTQMTLAVARALIDAPQRYSIESVMAKMADEFISWKHSADNNRAPGNTCLAGVKNLERGMHWSSSGIPNRPTCGAAMRTAPVGIAFYHDEAQLKKVASAASACTHAHPSAVASGVATAYLVSLAMRGVPPEQYVDKLVQFTQDISPEFGDCIKRIPKALRMHSPIDAISTLGQGWRGDEAVAIALYSFLTSPENYGATIIRAANHDGDSDSTACIAGAISGAYNGASAIPHAFVKHVENHELLERTAQELAEVNREHRAYTCTPSRLHKCTLDLDIKEGRRVGDLHTVGEEMIRARDKLVREGYHFRGIATREHLNDFMLSSPQGDIILLMGESDAGMEPAVGSISRDATIHAYRACLK